MALFMVHAMLFALLTACYMCSGKWRDNEIIERNACKDHDRDDLNGLPRFAWWSKGAMMMALYWVPGDFFAHIPNDGDLIIRCS